MSEQLPITMKRAILAVREEEELPDEMPDEMWEACRNANREEMTNFFRLTVRETKKGILNRLEENYTD